MEDIDTPNYDIDGEVPEDQLPDFDAWKADLEAAAALEEQG